MVLVNSYVQPCGEDFSLDYFTRLDASDSYVPTAEGLQLFSDGQGFYAAEKLQLPQWPRHRPSSFSYGFHAEVETTVHLSDAAMASSIELPSPIQSATSFPGVLDTHPPTLPFMQPSDPPLALSDNEARSLIEQYIQAAPWYREHEHEPLVGGESVPTCALQLAPMGESIYRCFVVPGKPKKNKPVFKCTTCEYMSDRLHRVVGHQRIKRSHKPFACEDDGCDFRGSTKESLGDHRSKRNNARWCPECHDPIVLKCLNRHLQDIHGY